MREQDKDKDEKDEEDDKEDDEEEEEVPAAKEKEPPREDGSFDAVVGGHEWFKVDTNLFPNVEVMWRHAFPSPPLIFAIKFSGKCNTKEH